MNNRIWVLYILLFTLYSCDNFVVKKDNKEDVLKEKWNEIDKNQVEKPPLFETCKNEAEELERCFQKTINEHVSNYLADHIITVKKAVNDTIWVPLLITKKGDILLEHFLIPDMIISQVPNFKKILEESIAHLPEVEPAHTHSTPVTTRYKLPLVIRIH